MDLQCHHEVRIMQGHIEVGVDHDEYSLDIEGDFRGAKTFILVFIISGI